MIDRKFGVEMEIVGISREQALSAMRAVGVEVQSEQYNHQTRSHWKLVSDASVHGGFEVVSPVLDGEAGLEELRRVATALDDMGATANRTCGLHVHIDAHGLSVEALRTIVSRYAAHEQEIDAFMPPSRRDNLYCDTLRRMVADARFASVTTIEELISLQPGRYHKVNLWAYRTHGTVEFRQHSGTVNAAKIVTWICFLQDFVRACCVPPRAAAAPAAVRGTLAALLDMLRAGDVTLDAMTARFGWQPHSARAAVTRLRRQGLTVTWTGTAYHLEEGASQSAAGQDNLWRGVSPQVCDFYRCRAAVLAVRN